MAKLENILISGSSGFIGSNLLPKLCKEFSKVFAITTTKDSSKFFQHENLIWIFSKEMIVPEDVLKSCDTLIHLASAGVNQDKKYDLFDLFNSNVNNSYKLIINCLDNGFKRIIYVGSCFEYGHMANIKNDKLSVYDALMPKDQYSATKAALTALLYPLTNIYETEIRIIRAFNIYGPNEKINRLYPTLMNAIKFKKVISITKGQQKKYFTPVETIVESILDIVKTQPKNNYFCLENQGGGKLMSVIEFAKSIFNDSNLDFNDLVKCTKKSRKGEPEIMAPNLIKKFQHQFFK